MEELLLNSGLRNLVRFFPQVKSNITEFELCCQQKNTQYVVAVTKILSKYRVT